MLVGKLDREKSDGPLFPGNEKLKYFAMATLKNGAAADLFDELSDEEYRQAVDAMRGANKNISFAEVKDNALWETHEEAQASLRKVQDYLVLSFGAEDDKEASHYCYYFKKVR